MWFDSRAPWGCLQHLLLWSSYLALHLHCISHFFLISQLHYQRTFQGYLFYPGHFLCNFMSGYLGSPISGITYSFFLLFQASSLKWIRSLVRRVCLLSVSSFFWLDSSGQKLRLCVFLAVGDVTDEEFELRCKINLSSPVFQSSEPFTTSTFTQFTTIKITAKHLLFDSKTTLILE